MSYSAVCRAFHGIFRNEYSDEFYLPASTKLFFLLCDFHQSPDTAKVAGTGGGKTVPFRGFASASRILLLVVGQIPRNNCRLMSRPRLGVMGKVAMLIVRFWNSPEAVSQL